MTQEVTENLNNSTANKETTSSNFILYKILLINKLLNPYFKISPKRKLQDKRFVTEFRCQNFTPKFKILSVYTM